MDHGADCINSGLSLITYTQIVGGENIHLYSGVFVIMLLSHVIFLEEYFTGSLDFPMINFVNEGIVLMCLNLLTGFFFGNQIYKMELFNGIRICDLLFLITTITAIVQFFWSNRVMSKISSVMDCVRNQVLIVYLLVVHCLVCFYSTNWVVLSYPKCIGFLFTFISSRIIISLMLAHVLDIPFNQFQRYPMMLITAQFSIFVFEKFFLIHKTPENQMIVGVAYILLMLVAFIYLCMYLYSLMVKISSVLNVNILNLNPRQKDKSSVSFHW